MPRYAFRCPACQREFDVERPMRDAGRPATCPEDGRVAERVFTAPGLRLGSSTGPTGRAGGPEGAPPRRYWSSPFFPARERRLEPAAPRNILPPGSSKPTSFRHFGHWHPAGTAPHAHRAPRTPRPKRRPSKG